MLERESVNKRKTTIKNRQHRIVQNNCQTLHGILNASIMRSALTGKCFPRKSPFDGDFKSQDPGHEAAEWQLPAVVKRKTMTEFLGDEKEGKCNTATFQRGEAELTEEGAVKRALRPVPAMSCIMYAIQRSHLLLQNILKNHIPLLLHCK